ncbi:MAG TPA: pitrilysin family protein [Gemmatimonadaceae bacterium]|nr:pitrilysin family protein [Gemmatimonadaceae bacterium]
MNRPLSSALLISNVVAATCLSAQSRPDTSTQSYMVAGIQVIHRRAALNDIVAANVYLLGGSRQLTFANAGIEPLLLAVSERGTAHYTREQLRRQLARSGSTIVIDTDRDWSMLGLRTTRQAFLETWTGFADRIVAPRLDTADVRIEREDAVSALAQRRDSPDDWTEHLADSVAFAGHPYGIDPVGNDRSVAGLTAAALKSYHRDQFVKSRMLVVVVGDVERPIVDSLVAATLGALPAGTYRWTLPDTLPRRAATVYREQRALPTNYLIGYAPGPKAGDPDYDAMRVACAILSGQLFAVVRSRQSLTYAVNAPFEERAASAVGLYVTTNDPIAAVTAMRNEIRALQEEAIDGRSLAPLIQQFITEYFLDNETMAAQANFLARAQLYYGDWRRGNAFSASLRAVTPADIQRVMKRYFRDLNFAYVGDATKLPDSAIRF